MQKPKGDDPNPELIDEAIAQHEVTVDPSTMYVSPQALMDDVNLDDSEKLELLRIWEEDVRERQVATEENMGGGSGKAADTLSEIRAAISKFPSSLVEQTERPTKHGG